MDMPNLKWKVNASRTIPAQIDKNGRVRAKARKVAVLKDVTVEAPTKRLARAMAFDALDQDVLHSAGFTSTTVQVSE